MSEDNPIEDFELVFSIIPDPRSTADDEGHDDGV